MNLMATTVYAQDSLILHKEQTVSTPRNKTSHYIIIYLGDLASPAKKERIDGYLPKKVSFSSKINDENEVARAIAI